ncbi:hypothetical protein CBER1_07434 [Cercospora berteroae]|uniref:EamA domain-containing protein n=1 Tax=Cercospora berteroae TaxID=357750 RepID=A0A2S6C7X8_9PEZI|nr:hypothetical protein CBER1_07434 [Cercospora berteroae]
MSKQEFTDAAAQQNASGRAEIESEPVERVTIEPKGTNSSPDSPTDFKTTSGHGPIHLVGADPSEQRPVQTTVAELERREGGRFAYLKKPQFYFILLLSQALAVTITGTNTITSLLREENWAIPAFQSLFNYILLNAIYTSITIYKYGFKKWGKMIYKDGWRYFILGFCDVQGNYFTVLAYNYTTILSAQLINFWAIAVVLLVSIIFLKVRYHWLQYAGILICCGGLGILVASDHIRGTNGGQAVNAVKGDLFALVGATFYGLTNVAEEFLVSKRPMYEVIGQLAFWAMPINGVQAAIFDRASFRAAQWSGQVGAYLVGYTLLLTWFYSAVPLLLRMASAAFLNIGLLTGNFWGVIVGIKIFNLSIHWMYPIAFVLIMVGHFIYYGTEGVLGEAKKPWLGENQEGGDDGIGSARRRLENPNAFF